MQSSSKDKKSDADLTLSNTENISLEDLLAGDRRLLEAHQAAVNKILKSLEQHDARLTSGDEEC